MQTCTREKDYRAYITVVQSRCRSYRCHLNYVMLDLIYIVYNVTRLCLAYFIHENLFTQKIIARHIHNRL